MPLAVSVYFDERRRTWRVRFRDRERDVRRTVPRRLFVREGLDPAKDSPSHQRIAWSFALETQRDVETEGPPLRARMTLREIFELYKRVNPEQVEPITLVKYEENLAHLERILGELAPEQIDFDAAAAYRNKRIETDKARNRTVRNELATLRRLLLFGYARRTVTGMQSLELLKAPKVRRQERRGVALTPERFGKMLKERPARDADRVRRILIVGVTTLLRRKVLLGLRWEWIDTRRKWMTIPAEMMKGAGGEKRALSVPLSEWTIEALGPPRSSGYVFPNPVTGGPTKRIDGSMTAMCRKAKVPRLTLHDLRRTGASWLYDAGVPTLVRKVLLGHKVDVEVTELYTFVTESKLKEAVGVFDRIREQCSQSGAPN